MIFLRGLWRQKPRQWGPESAVRGAFGDRFEDLCNISRDHLLSAFFSWGPGSQHNYGSGSAGGNVNAQFKKNSLYFNPSLSSYVNATNMISGLSELSVLQTVDSDATTTAIDQAIFGQWGTNSQVLVWFDAGYQKWQALVRTGYNGKIEPGTKTPSGDLETVCLTYDGSNLRLFAGGEIGGSAPLTGDVRTSTDDVFIGASNESGYARGFAGYISQTIVSDRAFCEATVQELSENPFQLVQPPTLRMYSMPTETDTQIISLSGAVSSAAGTSGEISKQTSISGSSNCVASCSGSISNERRLSVDVSAIAETEGYLSIEGIISLSGGVASVAAAAGEIGVEKSLSGIVSAIAAAGGELVITGAGETILFSGGISAESGVSGLINVAKNFSGTIEAVDSASGDLSAMLSISGDVDAISSIVGALSIIVPDGLGVVINPSIDSVTVNRIIQSIIK